MYSNMNVITLRPRGFIPFWNRGVYTKYREWAQWFWRGAVHIDDVASAVMLGVDLYRGKNSRQHLVLPLDSAYEYTDSDLERWDADGAGSTFQETVSGILRSALRYPRIPPRSRTGWTFPRRFGGWDINPRTVWQTCCQTWRAMVRPAHRDFANFDPRPTSCALSSMFVRRWVLPAGSAIVEHLLCRNDNGGAVRWDLLGNKRSNSDLDPDTVMAGAGRPPTTLLRPTLQVVDGGPSPAMTRKIVRPRSSHWLFPTNPYAVFHFAIAQ